MVAMVAVTSAVLLIIMSARFVRYLAEAAVGKLSGDVLLWIMFYRLPGFFELILPLGFFIAILLAYGRLYVESEMVVLTACGFSTNRLLVYTLIPALFIALVMSGISLYLSPMGMNKAQQILSDPKNKNGFGTLVPGRFQVAGSGRVSYVEGLHNHKKDMDNVFMAQVVPRSKGKAEEISLIFAKTGKIVEKEDSRYLELGNGYRYVMKGNRLDYSSTGFERFGTRLDEAESVLEDSSELDALPTSALLASSSLAHSATLQWRISLSLIIPIVAIIALSLSKTNHRQGRYVKMLPAILIYLIYLLLLNAGRGAIEGGKLSPVYGLWVIHAAFLALGLAMLYLPGAWQRMRYNRNSRMQVS
ncbi:lipopolysaccharide export system permease protein [Sinobacterium caligoides]|uniref:Lipopolysaccharide export system permease protein LptF n=2 Tax=Sinobacterium caligoides TaxID=933926 RepID=A0A3N2DZF3_9GAMM|nr:lipopolysaccharide export system permease protein [Sinobacterium caligoides]